MKKNSHKPHRTNRHFVFNTPRDNKLQSIYSQMVQVQNKIIEKNLPLYGELIRLQKLYIEVYLSKG